MNQYLAIFQIGPVQEYISCAKRTQDFWSGSYILSYLSAVAIVTVNNKLQDKIIYPVHDNDEIVNAVNAKPEEPSEHNFKSVKKYIGTLPNRFVAIHDEKKKLVAVLNESKKNVIQAYQELVSKVKSKLEKKTGQSCVLDKEWNSIWERQSKDFIETCWAIYDINPSIDYGGNYGNYMNAERLFGARKGIRDFKQILPPGEPGEKCTLCGERQALIGNTKLVKEFWKELVLSLASSNYKYSFRENDRLCSTCVVKRLAPDIFFKAPLYFPSTSAFAVSSALDELARNWDNMKIQESAQDFIAEFNKLNLSHPNNNRPIPIIKSHLKNKTKNNHQQIFRWDGRLFIADTYQPDKLVKEYKIDKNAAQPTVESCNSCRNALKKLMNNLKNIPMSKYYAVLMMDGDNMGEHLSECKDEKEHRNFSERLSDFSREIVPLLAEQYFRGKVVYFGGDEGVIFVGLEDLLPLMRCLRAAFSGHIILDENKGGCQVNFGIEGLDIIEDKAQNKQYKTVGKNATACIGAVIAHHQQSLLQVIEEVHTCLERAKKEDEKDSFCIALMKRSGGTTRSIGKWYYQANRESPGGVDVLEHLEKMKDLYRKSDGLSGCWLFDLDREKTGLNAINTEAVRCEIRRLCFRHCGEKHHAALEPLVNETGIIIKGITPDSYTLDNFIQLEFIANYIAKGGGN
ncbi:MAG: type III-B CRISPR-associated protein Cas10/Cmr2 [Desulfobacterales bacterium]